MGYGSLGDGEGVGVLLNVNEDASLASYITESTKLAVMVWVPVPVGVNVKVTDVVSVTLKDPPSRTFPSIEKVSVLSGYLPLVIFAVTEYAPLGITWTSLTLTVGFSAGSQV